MKYIPILFSTPMVEAILNGTKKQTRRIIKSNHESGLFEICKDMDGNITSINSLDWDECCLDKTNDIKPKANIGDIFWVRETFEDYMGAYNYKAGKYGLLGEKWKPSIFMPKDVCRIFLEVTNVRVERLHDISEEDAELEGAMDLNCGIHGITQYKSGFQMIWENINGIESWNENPYVWVYDFELTEKPENF